jgi:uncharacterized membrane protein YadS
LGDAIAGETILDAHWWKDCLAYAQFASEWLLLIGMAAVGLGVTFAHVREAGWRPVAVAFVAAVATGATGLGLIVLFARG